MSFGSVKLTHNDGTMHHLGIDERAVAPQVVLTPDPLEVPQYAALLTNAEKVGEYREYVTYTGLWNGVPLSVMSCGFGCMPMAIAVEELHHLGVRRAAKIARCPSFARGRCWPPPAPCAATARRANTSPFPTRPCPTWRC